MTEPSVNEVASDGSDGAEMATGQPSLDAGRGMHDRDERLTAGAEQLESADEGTIWANPRILLLVAATLMSVGLTLILLGYVGAARTTIMEEQIPYLISGGILGLALSIIGALSLFGHWQTTQLREARAQAAQLRHHNAAVLEELRGLRHEIHIGTAQAWEAKGDADTRIARGERPLQPGPAR